MRSHIDTLADQELGRPHLIEKDKRSHHLLLRRRQGAADLKGTEITCPRHDHMLDGVTRQGIAGLGS
jgi:hypothetical protein